MDATFDMGMLMGRVPDVFGFTELEDLVLQPDGRIYIGGHIISVQGIPRYAIARLMPDGRFDSSFHEHAPKFNLGGDIHRLVDQRSGDPR